MAIGAGAVSVRQYRRGGGIAHPLVFLVAFYGLSHCATPLALVSGRTERFTITSQAAESPFWVPVLWAECVAFACLIAGIWLGMRAAKRGRPRPTPRRGVSPGFALLWLVAGLTFAVVWLGMDYSRVVGLAKGYFQWERDPLRQALSNGTNIFTLAGIWLTAMCFPHYDRPLRLFIVLATLAVLTMHMVLLQRGHGLAVVLVWWLAASMRGPRPLPPKGDLAFAVAIGAFFLLSNLAFRRQVVSPSATLSAVTESSAGDWLAAAGAVTHLGYGQAHFVAALELMPDVRLYGQSYLAALVNLVPALLLGGYAMPPFVFEFSRAMVGGHPHLGANMSLEAEAFLNFGHAGPPLVFLCYAFALGYSYRRGRDGDPLCRAWYVLLAVTLLACSGASVQSLAKLWVYSYVLLLAGGSLRRAAPYGQGHASRPEGKPDDSPASGSAP
jgi:hypothetical protein